MEDTPMAKAPTKKQIEKDIEKKEARLAALHEKTLDHIESLKKAVTRLEEHHAAISVAADELADLRRQAVNLPTSAATKQSEPECETVAADV